jgi:hypothetical protein
MMWALLSFVLLAGALLGLFSWSFYHTSRSSPLQIPAAPDAAPALRHALHFPQVRQCFSASDLAYLTVRGSRGLAKRARAERHRVAARYVKALHNDFQNLFRLGRVLAAFSPEVATRQEAERFWLAARFECRYQVVRTMLLLGFSPVWQLQRMTQMVGTLSSWLDAAMAELGERAALAMEMASRGDRGRVNLV